MRNDVPTFVLHGSMNLVEHLTTGGLTFEQQRRAKAVSEERRMIAQQKLNQSIYDSGAAARGASVTAYLLSKAVEHDDKAARYERELGDEIYARLERRAAAALRQAATAIMSGEDLK